MKTDLELMALILATSQVQALKIEKKLTKYTYAFNELYTFLEQAPFDFKNGNTHEGIDEGEVLGSKCLVDLLEKFKGLKK